MYHSTTADVVLCRRGTPIASFGKQGIRSHLRLGPLVIVTGPQCPGSPIFDPCSIAIGYADRPTADAIVSWALNFADTFTVQDGAVVATTTLHLDVGTLMSFASIYRDSELKVQAGGIMVRTSKNRGVAFGLVGRRVPVPIKVTGIGTEDGGFVATSNGQDVES